MTIQNSIKTQFDQHLAELSRNGTPQFTDLPSQHGKCPHTGLKRGFMLGLPERTGGLVKIVKLSEPGAKRGKLLVDLPRLLAYLKAVADLQEGVSA